MANGPNGLTYTEYTPGTTGELPTTYQAGSEGSVVTQVLDITKPTSPEEIHKAILGWSSWQGGVITRNVPLACGAIPWLYAVQTSMHAVGKRSFNAASNPTKQAGYMGATIWRTHVTYKSLPYQVEADPVDVGRLGLFTTNIEYHRYAEWQLTPGVEVIERQISGQFKYATGAPNAGTSFPRNINRRAPKSHLLLRMHQMPHRALFAANHVLKSQFLRALCCVNSTPWPSQVSTSDPSSNALPVQTYRPGEVLLTQIGLNPIEAPVSPKTVGCNPRSNIPRLWTMDLHFIVFTPSTDAAVDSGGFFGHQLVPSMSADLNANYYYLVTANGLVTGKRIYDDINYDDTLFTYT